MTAQWLVTCDRGGAEDDRALMFRDTFGATVGHLCRICVAAGIKWQPQTVIADYAEKLRTELGQ